MGPAHVDTDSAPRRRVDRPRVLEAAEAIVDEHGWDHLTMAALAQSLGIKVPSLYNHVDNLESLKAELQVRTMVALGEELQRAAMGRTGRDGLVELAKVHRDFVRRYPRRYEGAMRAPLDRDAFSEASVAANAALLAVMRSEGLPADQARTAELAVFAAFHGFVLLEASGLLEGVVDLDAVFARVVDVATSSFEAAA